MAFQRSLAKAGLLRPALAGLEPVEVPAHEQYLSDQLDRLRDDAKDIDPDTSLKLFHSFLDKLPADASATIRYRVKANIGLQHLARGDGPEALRLLIEACDEAPDDPRAVANRALALHLSGDAEEAYRFGRERLAADPTNEVLASYLPQIAVRVASITDGFDGIPQALRDKEPVVVGQAVFLRGRNLTPRWWDFVKAARARFPDSEQIKLLAAFAEVDEIAHDEAAQRSQIFAADQRQRLADAAAILDASWQARPWLLKSAFDDAAQTLANAMIAYRMLHDRDSALSRATRIADEAITDPVILCNAVMVALSFNRDDVARRLIALLPEDPDLAFHAGVIALHGDDWAQAAMQFGQAAVPDGEKRIVETVIALAPIKAAGRPADGNAADPAPLEALIEATHDSPRGLILIAQVATMLGLDQLSEKALSAAVAAVPEDCHIATRLMVAHQAARAGSPATLIQLLDGHLPFDGFDLEHERLAVAHANEHPHRPRNLAYFGRLPGRLRQLHGIARAHASLLLDLDQQAEALRQLRRLHAEDPTDTFVTLRLVEALRRSGDVTGIAAVLRAVDLRRSSGPAEQIMLLAQWVVREGHPERAYPVAYDLVRRHADNPQVVLGYAGLSLLLQDPNPMFAMSVAGVGAYVAIEGPDGTRQNFVIDEGGDFFGLRVLPPHSGMTARVNGLHRGDTFALPKLGMDDETWTVIEVTTKYLHLYHRVLEEFETRFPDTPGLARFTVGQDNVDKVLEIVRRSADQNANNARLYVEEPLPLGLVARAGGGDVVSFAQFVRRVGGRIVTCAGTAGERARATTLVRRFRSRGAVLDPYTAWIAAEIDVLPALKAFFGGLRTPASTIAMIDRMIAREDEGRGREQMTLSFQDGQYYRNEITDEFRDRQIAAITRVRETIVANCEIVPVLVPDHIPGPAEIVLGVGGSRFLDAAFAAIETGTLLLSDDMRYRDVAAAAVACEGAWLQVALSQAAESRNLSFAGFATAMVGLAERRHEHLALSAPLLYAIARQDTDSLPGLRAALEFLAGPKAEMSSHRAVLQQFLELLWSESLWRPEPPLPFHRIQSATGLALNAFLFHGVQDWRSTLRQIINLSRGPLSEYLSAWLRGHFIAKEHLTFPSGPLRRKTPRGSKAA
ncbi:tetratricopeptide (TPR) repeat protein [Bradyrhizobium sp. JR7.2]|uniref:PIN domain-containing protein n=1 Tax=unclassified Bradyrhizobium TaxID=2631580 RepID=UPI00339A6E76